MKSAWSKKQFKDWVEKLEVLGLAIIPEIKLLTHQEKFFQGNFQSLMYDKSTYDPRVEEVYRRIFGLLDEVIELIHPEVIHIGHDEVVGHTIEEQRVLERMGKTILSADLFLQDVLRLHAYLKAKGIETWMWGDMLISPDEFPSMLYKLLHGDAPGYGKELRNKLPKDIVICDWHYYSKNEFPSLAAFKQEGFRVLGATWKNERNIRDFSRYAAKHGATGMIATTWFHVQKKEWDTVEQIIKESGEIFLKDFPDAK